MKIRGGFVSNSSSSSFVIGLPADQEVTFGMVAKAMFPDNEVLRGGFGSGYGLGVSTVEAVQSVLEGVMESGEATKESLVETIHCLDSYGATPDFLKEVAKDEPDYETVIYGTKDYRYQPELSKEERQKRWDRLQELQKEWGERIAATMEEQAKKLNVKWYVLEYGDDSSFGAAMEHGGVFDDMIYNGKAVRISNH